MHVSSKAGRNQVYVGVKVEQFDWPYSEGLPDRASPSDRLLFSGLGQLTVRLETMSWLVPAGRGLWVPRGRECEVRARGEAAVLVAAIESRVFGYPTQYALVALSPLLQELCMTLGEGKDLTGEVGKLLAVKLETLPREGIILPLIGNRRLQPIMEMLIDDPAMDFDLADWARELDFDPYRLMRMFRRETGLTIFEWQYLSRALVATEALTRGEPADRVAEEVGLRDEDTLDRVFQELFGVGAADYVLLGMVPSP